VFCHIPAHKHASRFPAADVQEMLTVLLNMVCDEQLRFVDPAAPAGHSDATAA
jgi:hypothetical protein